MPAKLQIDRYVANLFWEPYVPSQSEKYTC